MDPTELPSGMLQPGMPGQGGCGSHSTMSYLWQALSDPGRPGGVGGGGEAPGLQLPSDVGSGVGLRTLGPSGTLTPSWPAEPAHSSPDSGHSAICLHRNFGPAQGRWGLTPMSTPWVPRPSLARVPTVSSNCGKSEDPGDSVCHPLQVQKLPPNQDVHNPGACCRVRLRCPEWTLCPLEMWPLLTTYTHYLQGRNAVPAHHSPWDASFCIPTAQALAQAKCSDTGLGCRIPICLTSLVSLLGPWEGLRQLSG